MVATPTTCTDGLKIGQTDPATKVASGGEDVDFSDAATQFRNNFDRTAAYLSYPIGKHFLPMGGFQYGNDTSADGSKFHSKGAFADGVVLISEKVAAGFRYDWFTPTRRG